MNFYVPTIGDKIYLEENWHFTLHQEHRNRSLAKKKDLIGITETPRRTYRVHSKSSWATQDHPALVGEWALTEEQRAQHAASQWTENMEDIGPATPWKREHWLSSEQEVFLPRQTCLIIDRIYIRKGSPDYDSITFRIAECPDKKLVKARFWVKLRDANKIICSLYPVFDIDSRERLDKNNRFSNLDLE